MCGCLLRDTGRFERATEAGSVRLSVWEKREIRNERTERVGSPKPDENSRRVKQSEAKVGSSFWFDTARNGRKGKRSFSHFSKAAPLPRLETLNLSPLS